ncbi:MAG: hypothetical protein ACPL5I_16235 [Thermodesulfobacteriota bacterium]
MKNKGKLITLISVICFLAIVAGFYQSFLKMAGDFFAPERLEKAEAVIIEGSELVREDAVKIGLDLISQGKANLLVIVYQNSPEEKVFGRPPDYKDFLFTKLWQMGLSKEQILILEVPKEHPITLIEAQTVLPYLAKRGIKKAILLAESFHTRRSFWAYKQVGEKIGINIYPSPFFLKYKKDNWWENNQGIRELGAESVKFIYYLVRGYIPIKSFWAI